MHRAANRDRMEDVGKKVAAGVRAWMRHADAEEEERGYTGLNVAAAWTKEGVLVVIARRAAAHRIDALLRDENIAKPQYRERAK